MLVRRLCRARGVDLWIKETLPQHETHNLTPLRTCLSVKLGQQGSDAAGHVRRMHRQHGAVAWCDAPRMLHQQLSLEAGGLQGKVLGARALGKLLLTKLADAAPAAEPGSWRPARESVGGASIRQAITDKSGGCCTSS